MKRRALVTLSPNSAASEGLPDPSHLAADPDVGERPETYRD
jgi:hypothetical protein